MADFVHGKDTVVMLGGDDLSPFTDTSSMNRGADVHDITTYGKEAHVFKGGLKNGTASIGGIYDKTAVTGPAAIIEPLIGTTVELIHQPAGTGASLPQAVVDVVVGAYNTSHPAADMVKWSLELTFSDVVDTAPQSA